MSAKSSLKLLLPDDTQGALYQWIPLLISLAMLYSSQPLWALVVGLMLFGAVFAVNSSLHSYLIVSYAGRDGVSLDVGFYYMANAMGRLIGTLLSGWIYQAYGMHACLWLSSLMLGLALSVTFLLARSSQRELAVTPHSYNSDNAKKGS